MHGAKCCDVPAAMCPSVPFVSTGVLTEMCARCGVVLHLHLPLKLNK